MPKRKPEAADDEPDAAKAGKKSKKQKLAADESQAEVSAAAPEAKASKALKKAKKESAVSEAPTEADKGLSKRQQKKIERANRKKERKQKPLDEASRQERNKLAREKGVATKKDEYRAKRASLKEQALTEKTTKLAGGKLGAARLEAEALSAAGLEAMDPKRTECFITGLNYMTTEDHITEHFAVVGSCKVSILWDDAKGRSSGKAFVTFDSAEKALKACTYNATKLQKRWINIRLCEPRGGASRDATAGPGERPEGCLTAVAKCDISTSEASLWKFFEDCKVVGVKRWTDSETGEFTGQAFLDFEDGPSVEMAVKKSGKTIKGKPIMLRYKR